MILRDKQRWMGEALVVEQEGDIVTLRYDPEDEDDLHCWGETVRLDSIGALSIRLAYFSRPALSVNLETASDYPSWSASPARARRP